ncbi:hypothetical protein OWM07_10075 [Deferribacter thermophilus]|uniref:hypothetical protein n=1 Tax=Deferribacter thermophilus TaxID=53573 RepID=UPI003C22F1B7
MKKFNFRYIFVLILIVFLLSCSTKNKSMLNSNTDTKVVNIFNDLNENEDNILKFESNMPKSDFILNGVVHFKRRYTVKTITDNVTDFYISNDEVFLLKNGIVKTNIKNCYELLVEDNAKEIRVSGNYIYLNYQNRIDIYDKRQCGKIGKIDTSSYQYNFENSFILLFLNRHFRVLDVTGKEILSGYLFKKIEQGKIFNKKLYLLNSDNELVVVDVDNKVIGKPDKIKSDKVYFLNDYIILEKNKKYYKLKYEDYLNYSKICYPLKKGDYPIFCFDDEKVFSFFDKLSDSVDKIMSDNEIYFFKSKNMLKYANLGKKVYFKEILLNRPKLKACKTDNGYILFDIDGDKRFIDTNKYSIDKLPEKAKCDKELTYKYGVFYENGNPIIKIAKVVNENEKYKMLKREIDENNIYYYFDKKVDTAK